MSEVYINARIYTGDRVIERGSIRVENDRIVEVADGAIKQLKSTGWRWPNGFTG